ncbi:MAG: hypothetical protein Q8Q17_03040 [bacterium]|nr:hypothetical protein [bacterium]
MTPEKITGNAEAPETDVPQSPEKQVNEFGLPLEWARGTSLAGLEEIRIKGIGAIKEILLRAYHDLKEFDKANATNNASDVGEFTGLDTNSPHDADHLAMTMEERIAYFNRMFPKGLAVMKSGVFVKWEEMLPYELWAIQNHQQTLYTLHQRGGIGSNEAAAIRFGVSYRNKIIESVPNNKSVNWLRSNGMLKE